MIDPGSAGTQGEPASTLRRNRAEGDRERFAAAGAAHDLANYLQAIASAVRIIERSLPGETRVQLDPVVRGAYASIEHACSLSRQVAARGAQRRERPVRTMIGERLSALQAIILLAAGSNVVVELCLEDAPAVMCDGNAFDDAVMNLVVNAVRAMPDGGRLSIGLSRERSSPDALPEAVVRVADTGCGMSPAMAAAAFGRGVTTKTGAGFGLGLAAVEAFARSSGGSAEIESRIGLGTIVSVRLPAALKIVSGA